MGTEYYEDDRLVREKTDLTGTLTGTITPELVFKKNSGGRWEVLQFYQPEVISSMPFPEKENCLSKGIFGDGVNPGKGIKVPIALLYCEEDGKDGIASHFGTVDGVAPSGDLYRKIETLPEKLGKYTILYYILENVEK